MITIPDDKDMSYKNLRGADFSGTDLRKVNLEYADLRKATFKEARLIHTNLSGANLEGANFERAILQGADLRKANLRGANLSETYSMWTDFRGANLVDANLRKAIVEGARFEDSSLKNTSLVGISYNRATCWPKGFNPSTQVMMTMPQAVKNVGGLLEFISELSRSWAIDYEGSLEEYLRALFILIHRNKDKPVSVNLTAQLFIDAFQEAPTKFDDGWRQYALSPSNDDIEDDFYYLERVILTQVAELHGALEQSQATNFLHARFWYNLSVESYLECAASGFYSHCSGTTTIARQDVHPRRDIGCSLESHFHTWRDMAEILSLGKTYE